MPITGKNFIGYTLSADGEKTFQSYIPAEDQYLPEKFYTATATETDKAISLAGKAFNIYSKIPASQRADFLVAITEEIIALGAELIHRANLETGLPLPRLHTERERTITQLNQFADLIREGSWVDASVDTAIPDRSPAPKPDLRKMHIPVGPVIVFGSSNFPFAYSVAGVDTGPALAAGNPVIVKAHAAHPGVSDLTAQAVVKAAQRTGMPEGVFSMVYDDGFEVGTQLVKHPVSKAVGFTGSFKGGMALYKLAQEREEPIPVYAEMGSVNPIVVLPEYLRTNAEKLAKTLASSVTLGAGQFCTNPGIVFVTDSEGFSQFKTTYADEITATAPHTMLTAGICKTFFKLKNEAKDENHVGLLAQSDQTSELHNQSQATVLQVSGDEFIKNSRLQEEVFGPFSLLVVCRDTNEVFDAICKLRGQLTASLMTTESEAGNYPEIISQLSKISGRFVMNGVPTGVEVCPSMHHGGPFPAASISQFTSVGRHSILRF
ncbi:MAG TPA: aldehyde dehydrogenase (NADP(+)), partial [Dyadobacter sp.]|nr:aldehyde dehydrogenase (NADP(+)) [Dyadobacter sp.]